jgi:hypothetical protein
MLRHCTLICLATALLLSAGGTARGQKWGDLKGRFVLDGTAQPPVELDVNKDQEVCGKEKMFSEELVVGDGNGLANVFIYLVLERNQKIAIHPDYEAVSKEERVLDNVNCRFVPHAQTVWLSQTLILKNSDPVAHNSKIDPLGDTPTNPLIPAGGQVPWQFKKSQGLPQTVTCSIHGWMKAWVLPLDHPYAAVSGPDGSFEIKNVPVGEHTFQLWHERSGYLMGAAQQKDGKLVLSVKPKTAATKVTKKSSQVKLKIAEGVNDVGQEIKVSLSYFEGR